jgi:hypothetical protein
MMHDGRIGDKLTNQQSIEIAPQADSMNKKFTWLDNAYHFMDTYPIQRLFLSSYPEGF